MKNSLYKDAKAAFNKFKKENKEFLENKVLVDKLNEISLKHFPEKDEDGFDLNWLRREAFKAGAYWGFKQRKTK